jgi:xylan 1,4-beta-xylosidase
MTKTTLACAFACAAVTALAQSVPPRVVVPAVREPQIDPVRDPARTALFLVGDLTVKDNGPSEGWGDYLAPLVDDRRLQVLNWAGDDSAMTSTERWRRASEQMRRGDYVLLQSAATDTTVLQSRLRDAQAKGAATVLLSTAPANRWRNGAFDNDALQSAARLRQLAEQQRTPFIDHNALLAMLYAQVGEAAVTSRFFFRGEMSQRTAEGAEAAALTLVDGIRSQPALGLVDFLQPSAALLSRSRTAVAWGKGIEGQRKADLGNGYYLNPIVSGDHPDPSILKDGNDYYMTFSSFDAYPGLVIWQSRDLVNWTPIGPTLFKNVGAVWAPDLVKHNGRYYIYFPGIAPYRSTYVIWADNIRGPWSDPIDLTNRRIDPGHAVGPDGKRYLFLSAGYLVELAPDGLSIVGDEKKIYDGWPYPADWVVETFAQEGPKVIKRGDYYYQVLAQGGTAGPATGHMIVAARSKTIQGPWEHSPHNPILRTESADERWWSKGHGTLVEGPDARWWIVYHAYENGFYNLGRQTLLEPIEWLDDGWFRRAKYDPARPIPKPLPESTGVHGLALSDDFSTDRMGIQWSFYAGTAADRARYRLEKGALVLKAAGTSPADSAPLWFVTGDHAYEVEVEVGADPGASAGLLVFYNRRLYGGLGFSPTNLILHTYGMDRPGAKPKHIGQRLHLRLRNDRHIVGLEYSVDGRKWERFDRRLEVSGYHHNVGYDFLSLRPAIYAAGSGEVRFRNFVYRALP